MNCPQNPGSRSSENYSVLVMLQIGRAYTVSIHQIETSAIRWFYPIIVCLKNL